MRSMNGTGSGQNGGDEMSGTRTSLCRRKAPRVVAAPTFGRSRVPSEVWPASACVPAMSRNMLPLLTAGSVPVQFGGCGGVTPNCIPIVKGWNYMVRLYRPGAEILNGRWKLPEAKP